MINIWNLFVFKLELNLNINISPLKKRQQNVESAITVDEDVGAIELCGEGSGDYMNRTFMFVVITTEGTADCQCSCNSVGIYYYLCTF